MYEAIQQNCKARDYAKERVAIQNVLITKGLEQARDMTADLNDAIDNTASIVGRLYDTYLSSADDDSVKLTPKTLRDLDEAVNSEIDVIVKYGPRIRSYYNEAEDIAKTCDANLPNSGDPDVAAARQRDLADLVSENDHLNTTMFYARELRHEIENAIQCASVATAKMKILMKKENASEEETFTAPSKLILALNYCVEQQRDLLNTFTKHLETGSPEYIPMEMNAKESLEEACDIIEPLIETQGYHLEVEFRHLDKNVTFMGDRKRIRSVILNLAKNSVEALNEDPKIKAGEKKGKIYLHAESDDQHIRIIFGNNGPEIPSEHEERVYRGNFTTKLTGTGAGLMTCAHIIEKVFGGLFFGVNKSASVHPEDCEGEGVEFYVQLFRNHSRNEIHAYQNP